MLDAGWQDVRYAARSLARRPLVTSVAVLSLALGIGVNTAVFSVFERLLLRTLPVRAPEEIVLVTSPGPRTGSRTTNNSGGTDHIFSVPLFRDLERLEHTGLSHLAAHGDFAASLAHEGGTERGDGLIVSGAYFPGLGVAPALGRLLAPDDDRLPGGHPVVVLAHSYWKTRFGADPGIVGDTLVVNGQPMTIVGVAPEGFTGTAVMSRAEIFAPLSMLEQVGTNGDARDNHWLYLFGRLAPGITRDQAEARINVPFTSIIRNVEFPIHAADLGERRRDAFLARQIVLEDGSRGRMADRDEAGLILVLLMAVTGLVLLIACANLANLMLARAMDRAAEIRVRLSMGASASRVIRLLMTEACLLGALGGTAALLIGRVVMAALLAIMPASDAPLLAFELNGTLLAFSLALGLGTALLFGFFPALHGTRTTIARTHAGRVSDTRSTTRFRTALATAQIALATALLAQAGLFLISLVNVAGTELGIRRDGVITFRLSPYLNGYTGERALQFFDRVQEALRQVPGVMSVTASTVPVLADNVSTQNLTVEGFTPGPDTDTSARSARIGTDYFSTLGIPLLTGREFSRTDDAKAPKVAIVNEAFARKFKLGDQVVGRRVALGEADETALDIEIVGLVADAKYNQAREPAPPQFFMPYRQHGFGGLTFYARFSSDPSQLRSVVPAVVGRIDPNVPVERVRTMEEQIWDNVTRERVLATLSSWFAGLATLLAGIGLYAVLAYTVAQRLREIGIRVALGARPADVRRLLFGYVGRIVVVGGTIGAAAALGLGRLGETLLFGVQGSNVAVLVSAVVAIATVALAAGAIPARRAIQVDPVAALRAE